MSSETETFTETDIIYRSAGLWGTGKGSNLTSFEVDCNFFSLNNGTAVIEGDQFGGGITSVSVTADQITFTLSDARTFGPFTLPGLSLPFIEWVPNFDYSVGDFFVSENNRLYVVTTNHTSATEFDPLDSVTENALYHKTFGSVSFLDIASYLPGALWERLRMPTPLLQIVAEREFRVQNIATPGYAYIRVPPISNIVCAIMKNGIEFGLLVIMGGQNTGTVTIDQDTDFQTGDVLSLSLPIGHTESETATGTEEHGMDLSFALKAVYT